ncbi:MAG: hypothetical protein HZB62_14850 [Nitrospirae bacterium]|nr:hypothetical protein [Nitrospirota bacterium]
MKRGFLLLLTLGLLFGFVACVEAERRPYGNDGYGPYDRADRYDIGARIDNQQRRIDQGISSGELTRYEADVLIDNLNWIRDEYSRARRDGRLSQSEIERLSEHLNQNNRMIMDKRNNAIRRVYTPAPPPPPFAPAPAPRHEQPRNDMRDRNDHQYRRIDPGASSDEQPRMDLREIRMENQQNRINQAASKGELTRREAAIVQENLDRIRAAYSRMKADGRQTVPELDRIDKRLDRNDHMISDKRRNVIERLD